MVGDYKGISSAVWLFYFYFFLNPLEIFISGKPRNFFLSRICEEDAKPAVSTRILFTGQGGGVICYTHEAEERNKKKLFLIDSIFELFKN